MHYVTTASRFLADYPPLCRATEFSFAPQPAYISAAGCEYETAIFWGEREKKVEGERESERTNASPTSQMRDNISLGWGNALSKQESFSYSPLLSFDMDEICFDEISFLPGDVSQDPRRGGKLEPSPITFSTLTFLSSFPSARRE